MAILKCIATSFLYESYGKIPWNSIQGTDKWHLPALRRGKRAVWKGTVQEAAVL